MKNRVYLSVLLVGLLVVAVVAIVVATGKSDVDVASDTTEECDVFVDSNPAEACLVDDSATAGLFPGPSAGDLPPRDSVSRDGVYDSADGGGTFSGDDAYDPAAGGLASGGSGPSISVASESGACLVSFPPEDCLAASGLAGLPFSDDLAADSSYSGDDAYDPAAGGLASGGSEPSISASSEFGECLVSFPPESCPAASGLAGLPSSGDLAADSSYSGDDAYDPAAGGLAFGGSEPSISAASEVGECLVSFVPESCPAASGLAGLPSSGDAAAGSSYSGDDPYDAAAGGLATWGGSDLTVSGILESMGGQCSVGDDYAPAGAC